MPFDPSGLRRIALRCARAIMIFGAIALHGPAAADWIVKRDGGVVVIFVHGFLGDDRSSWLNTQTGAYWPKLLADDLALARSSVYVWKFDTNALAAVPSIDELAEQFRLQLDSDGVANDRSLVFIAHSMGGLVVRSLLNKYHALAHKTKFIYFLATPTTGTAVASVARLVGSEQLRVLVPMTSDSYLADVQRAWLAANAGIPSYCAYEVQSTNGVRIVEQQSASNLCNRRIDPIYANHVDIAKPKSASDTSYRAFISAWQEQSGPPLILRKEVPRKAGVLPLEIPIERERSVAIATAWPVAIKAAYNGWRYQDRRENFSKTSSGQFSKCGDVIVDRVEVDLPPKTQLVDHEVAWVTSAKVTKSKTAFSLVGTKIVAEGEMVPEQRVGSCGIVQLRLDGAFAIPGESERAKVRDEEFGNSEIDRFPVSFVLPREQYLTIESVVISLARTSSDDRHRIVLPVPPSGQVFSVTREFQGRQLLAEISTEGVTIRFVPEGLDAKR